MTRADKQAYRPAPARKGWAAVRTGVMGLREQLAGLGAAGVVAYGILNTAYYTAAFYLVWRHVARVPRGRAQHLQCTICESRMAIFD